MTALKRSLLLILSLIFVICVTASCGSAAKQEEPAVSEEMQEATEEIPAKPEEQEPEETEEVLAARQAALEEAQLCAAQYDYDRALELLSDPAIENEETADAAEAIRSEKEKLVPYEGEIRHIFFHSLIVYPEMIFRDKETPMGGYNAGFSEKQELEKILPQLYERGYVLYDPAECFVMTDGKMTRREILLPPEKQPLILSVDDVAYAYGKGFAQKLMVNEAGELVNLVQNPAGETEEMPDGDVFGVVDAFVREHPDFSYQGHKGTLAMTGYQGAFGFSFEDPEDQEEIRRVAAALREDGWTFASHSYTHNRKGFFGQDSNPDKIKYDTEKWMKLVYPFFEPTNIFIAPFGYRVGEQGMQHILNAGFQIYCTVDSKVINEVHEDYALMSRIEIGGYSMSHYQTLLNEKFFNVDEVFDAEGRPPVI